MNLKDKKVFITGGTGYVGRHMVLSFGRAGADIAFTFNQNTDAATELLKELTLYGGRYMALPMSVLDEEGVINTVSAVVRELGWIDVLVNNAGMAQVMTLPLIEQEDWDETFDINVRGCFFVTKEVIRNMIFRNQGGLIINMGSVAGLRMLEVPVHYAASKAAIHGLTYALAGELARYKIRVNCIAPGMLEGGVALNVPRDQYDDYITHCAAGRPGKPEEVAALAVFLATAEAAYINAQVLVCDGGL